MELISEVLKYWGVTAIKISVLTKVATPCHISTYNFGTLFDTYTIYIRCYIDSL